jgi:O-acetyl-ADP-ribose deacetylase (regulator of RNase III)
VLDVPLDFSLRYVLNNQIEIQKVDITWLAVDAIVNAANRSLLGGGGVDGAIHRAAGPELLKECRSLGGCPTGECRITKGYQLTAPWVIHTVGPVWEGGHRDEDKLLASCYRSCLDLAAQKNLKTIAFPAISCGVYGFPIPRACLIAWDEIREGLKRHPSIEKVILACYENEVAETYAEISRNRSGA